MWVADASWAVKALSLPALEDHEGGSKASQETRTKSRSSYEARSAGQGWTTCSPQAGLSHADLAEQKRVDRRQE
jgi:hypothetical protein